MDVNGKKKKKHYEKGERNHWMRSDSSCTHQLIKTIKEMTTKTQGSKIQNID